MKLLQDKHILIVGIASRLSIAAGIAEAMARAGARLSFSYQNAKLRSRTEEIALRCGATPDDCFACDVGEDQQIEALFHALKEKYQHLDGFVHSVGYAPQDQLHGDFTAATTRTGFRIAHDISAYSFIALAKAAVPILREGANLLTLTYYGSQKTLPNYNVMGLAKASLEAAVRYLAVSLGGRGIRVNAISAGPIRTLAASGIGDFRKMLKYNALRAPLKKNVTIQEVGNAATFLASDMASGITGEILFVDAGFNLTAMSGEEVAGAPSS